MAKGERQLAEGNHGGGVASIQSVVRAADFLGLFSVREKELTLGEITERLGLSRATVHRYGITLRNTGLVRYDAERGVYSLGPRIIELGSTALSSLTILSVAEPFMERLSADINETTVLTLWDGETPVVVRVANETRRVISLDVRVGSRLPIFTSVQGPIYLAFSEAARQVYEGHPELEALEPRLEEIRQSEAIISDGFVSGVYVVAAPIFGDEGLVAIISALAMGSLVDQEGADALAPAVVSVAKEISAALGSQT